jgi:hypothetical protein
MACLNILPRYLPEATEKEHGKISRRIFGTRQKFESPSTEWKFGAFPPLHFYIQQKKILISVSKTSEEETDFTRDSSSKLTLNFAAVCTVICATVTFF